MSISGEPKNREPKNQRVLTDAELAVAKARSLGI